MVSRQCTSVIHPAGLSRGQRRQHGFTLIELALVIAISIVLAVFALASFKESTRTFRLKNDTSNLANLLTFARMKGAATFMRSQVSCDTTVTPTLCKVVLYSPNGTSTSLGVNAPEVSLSQSVSLAVPTGVTLGPAGQNTSATGPSEGHKGQSASPYVVTFNTRGLPVTSATLSTAAPDSGYAYYLVDLSGNATAITVDLGGGITIWRLDTPTSKWISATNLNFPSH